MLSKHHHIHPDQNQNVNAKEEMDYDEDEAKDALPLEIASINLKYAFMCFFPAT